MFENNELGHNGERIVRIGINSQQDRLPQRIKTHFTGTTRRSIFRKHIGSCLKNVSAKSLENEISTYIRNNISFVIIEVNDKTQRENLEKELITTVSNCSDCTCSSVWLPEQLVTILAEYKSWYDEQKINYGDLWADTDKLFLQDNGNTLNPCTINLWLKKFNLEHGFKNIPPHSLRHTSITMQIKAGVPLKAVSARAGHSSERITLDIYTHNLQSQDEQAAEIYNNYLLG